MTTVTHWQDVDNNLTTPSFFSTGGHHEVFARLRAEDPVHWTEGNSARPFWSVTRYEDCTAVLEDAETFSSEHGGIMLETAEYPSAEEREPLGYGSNPTMTDPPRHLQIRRPFNKHWAAPSVGRLREQIQDCVDTIMAEVLPRGECDFVEDVAAQLPARLVSDIMGVPEEDRAKIRQYCGGFLSPHDPRYQIDGDSRLTLRTMMHNLHSYMFELALQRREDPRDDFTSVAAQLKVNGRPLDDRDLGWWTFSFVAAGLESTRNGLAVGVLELLKHPEQAERLRSNSSLVPTATEEILRWVTPSKYKWRIATRDCEIGGRAVRQGDWVVCWLVSANRDEEVFTRPDQLDVGRNPNPHLAFSVGEHSCIGRHLARLELQVALTATMQRMTNLRVAGPFEWQHSDNHTALVNLPVTFDRT
ncbi:cytochrome P450 [Streptomyces sp. NPDC059455]|uniref:cytochrome P450 n=1 Tax=Streptomyces sp. NPDC059455 TaxID=3346837 RepID=UPI00369C9D9A